MREQPQPDRDRQQTERRRFVVSLVLAVVLHAGIGWLITRDWFAPRPHAKSTVVITMIEPKREQPPKPPPPPIPLKEPERLPEDKQKHPPRTAKNAPVPPPPAPVPPAPPPPPSGPPVISPPIVQEQPAPPAPPGATSIDLFTGKGLQTTVDNWKASRPKPPSEGGEAGGEGDSPAAEHARVLGRITHDVVEYQAHDRVDSGLVDPYFTALARTMRESWKPTLNMVGGAEGKGAGGDLANFAQGWHAAAKKYGASGNPLSADAAPAGAPTHEFQRDPSGGTGFDIADFAARTNNGDVGVLSGVVVVQLTQNEKGETTDIRILQSSGSAALDESARAEMRRVAGESRPPAHGLGLGGPSVRSVWKMEARMVTNGLIPSATFDPSLGSASVQGPMQSRMVTRVELVAIYGGETGPHPTAPE